MEVLSNDRRYIFPCKRWLAEDEDDHQIVRDLHCSNFDDFAPKSEDFFFNHPSKLIESFISVTSKRNAKYHVTVNVSDRHNAGSFGDLLIWMIDDAGSKTKRILLSKRFGRKQKLEEGGSSTFQIEAKYLPQIKKIILGMKGFIEKVFFKI